MGNKNKRLKMLVLTEDFLPICGGITSVVEKSSLALSKYMDITIGTIQLSKKNKNYVQPPALYKVIRCRGWHNKITTNMSAKVNLDKNFRKEVEKEKYDIIHCHFPLSLLKYALKLGKKQKCPVVITSHSFFTPDVKGVVKSSFLANIITRIIVKRLNKADKIFCVSQFCKNHLLKFGLKNDAIVVRNAVEMAKDNCGTNSLDLETKYNFNKKTFLILAVGRLTIVKNLPMLIKSLSLVKEKTTNIKCLIVGDGIEKPSLQNLINKLKLNDIVELTGAITDRQVLCDLYKRANLIAFISFGDSSGLIQVEAAYFEKPTLALKNTAISEVIADGHNGLICENKVEKIADKIIYAYKNPKKLTEMGKLAKTEIYRSYFDENIIQELLDVYQKVIKEFQDK